MLGSAKKPDVIAIVDFKGRIIDLHKLFEGFVESISLLI
jgi:hypothetical protein